MKIIKRILYIPHLLGSRNWYIGVDKPNLFQYLYKWRIGIKTAWEVSKIIYK
jgi:hypothetical protein